jgi:hypothetical protein
MLSKKTRPAEPEMFIAGFRYPKALSNKGRKEENQIRSRKSFSLLIAPDIKMLYSASS